MTTSPKAGSPTSSSPTRPENGKGPDGEGGNGTPGSAASLDELARDQERITHEIRGLVARQALDESTDVEDDRERAGRLVTVARGELLQQLRHEEQEKARRQLAEATRSSEDAVAGVVRSVTTIVRTIIPAALVRPEDLIDAAYTLADQGLRVSRRVALTVSSSVRDLSTSV